MNARAQKQAPAQTGARALEELRGGDDPQYELLPEERPVVDELARECGLRPDNPGYFRLRGLLALMVTVIRQCGEYSIAEVIDENDDSDLLAKEYAEAVDVQAKEDFGLSDDERGKITAVVYRYVADNLSAIYTRQMSAADAAISQMADTLDIPVEQRDNLRKLIFSFIISSNEASDRASSPPRLKWEIDRLADENPATFAWRAYQAEAQAGTLHRGVIHAEDAELHRRLNSWLRSHPMPEGIDIPTKPEWITRQADAGKAKAAQASRPRTEEQRVYDALASRRYRARHGSRSM